MYPKFRKQKVTTTERVRASPSVHSWAVQLQLTIVFSSSGFGCHAAKQSSVRVGNGCPGVNIKSQYLQSYANERNNRTLNL